MVQNLVFEKFPNFERRLTTLQEDLKQLQVIPSDTGMIRLQTTPRQLETLEQQILENTHSSNGHFAAGYLDRIPSESTSEIQLQINQSELSKPGQSLLDLDDFDMNRLI